MCAETNTNVAIIFKVFQQEHIPIDTFAILYILPLLYDRWIWDVFHCQFLVEILISFQEPKDIIIFFFLKILSIHKVLRFLFIFFDLISYIILDIWLISSLIVAHVPMN